MPVFPTYNAEQILQALNKYGLTNPFIQAAILAITWKESLMQPKNENMNYTSASRLKSVFPSYFKTEADAVPFVRQPEKLANYVYGNKYGNTAPGDGWKYRGRGFNGLTFKGNYQRYGKIIGRDLVNNPDLVNEIPVAAEVLAAYMLDGLKNNGGRLQQMGVNDPNDFKDLPTAIRAAMRVNAGWGSSTNGYIFREGEARATEAAPAFLNFANDFAGVAIQAAVNPVGAAVKVFKNKKARRVAGIVLGTAAVVGTGLYLYNRK